MGKKDNKYEHSKKHHRRGVFYKIGLYIAFIFLKIIKPLLREKDFMKIIKGIIKVSISNKGVVNIDNRRYITRSKGWEQLERVLKDKGYETQILFRDCEFWKNDKERKHLKGKNIGEYFILWEGDAI